MFYVSRVRVPEGEAVIAGRQIYGPMAGVIRLCKIGGVGDINETKHPIMDITTQGHDAGLVKYDRTVGGSLVEFDFKALGGRK